LIPRPAKDEISGLSARARERNNTSVRFSFSRKDAAKLPHDTGAEDTKLEYFNSPVQLKGRARTEIRAAEGVLAQSTSKGRAKIAEAATEEGFEEECLNDVRDDLAERIPPDLWKLHWSLMTPQRRDIAVSVIAGLKDNRAWLSKYQAYLREHRPSTLIVWGHTTATCPKVPPRLSQGFAGHGTAPAQRRTLDAGDKPRGDRDVSARFSRTRSQLEPITRSPRLGAERGAPPSPTGAVRDETKIVDVTAMDHYLARCSRRGITEAIVTSSSGFRGRIKL
jgi:hypothetical protein